MAEAVPPPPRQGFVRGYHLLPERHAQSDITQRRLKVARLAEVNDPFELAALNCMKRDRRTALKNFKATRNGEVGMLCFCDYWKNPVMWSHYADQHRGVCLGFDVDPRLGEGLRPVEYVTSKLQLEGDLVDDTLPQDIQERLLVTKFKDWEYERERRTFIRLSALAKDGCHYFLSFGEQLGLREVILGPQCPRASLTVFERLAKTIDSEVLVSRARLGFKYFEVKHDGRFPPQ